MSNSQFLFHLEVKIFMYVNQKKTWIGKGLRSHN